MSTANSVTEADGWPRQAGSGLSFFQRREYHALVVARLSGEAGEKRGIVMTRTRCWFTAGFLVLYFSMFFFPAFIERFLGQALAVATGAMRGMLVP